MKTKKKLTDKQERFCLEYVIDLNGTQAAIRAGYSEKTAQEQSSQHLSKLIIQQRIAELQKDKGIRCQFNADNVFNALVKQATFDIKDIISVKQITLQDAKGNDFVRDYIHLQDWENIDGTLISEIKQNKDLMTQVKFYDKQKALELIGRHFAMFADKIKFEDETNDLEKIRDLLMDVNKKDVK